MSSEYVEATKREFAELNKAAKELRVAAWDVEREIVRLEIENKNLREALKQARLFAKRNGYTMREFAAIIGITATQLSVWTDSVPNREPDFKD